MNGILLVDKPQGWTSHDIVAKLRGVMHERRAGHSGTLDPMATGLLVIFFGRATRAVQFAESARKEYIAHFRLGTVTDTLDITGTVLHRQEADISDRQLNQVINNFTGDIIQLPPMYSAVKKNGQPLYKAARAGNSVERKPRPVTIYALEHMGYNGQDPIVRVECSKGTYIRSLADDIGRDLGCGACLSYLRRIRAGSFSVENAYTLDEVILAAEQGRAKDLLLPIDSLFADLPTFILTDNQQRVIKNGGRFTCNVSTGSYRAYSLQGEFIALTCVNDSEMRVIKSFYEI